MSLYDLFTGNFTWWQLLRELGPLVVSGIATFCAGYWCGRVAEQKVWLKTLRSAGKV